VNAVVSDGVFWREGARVQELVGGQEHQKSLAVQPHLGIVSSRVVGV